jgi:transposase
MVLGCLDGKQITEIAQAFGTRPNTVIKWRDRFAKLGIGGLGDAPRPGAKRVYDEGFRDQVLGLLDTPPPRGQSTWDGPAVASVLKCSPHAVWRVLRQEGRCLRRQRSWWVRTGPGFLAKTVELVGLYLDPPLKALVIGVAETSMKQPREPLTGYVLSDSGKTVRALKRAVRRQGALDLATALQAGTGQTATALTEPKRRDEFMAFLDQVLAGPPAAPEIHVMVDGYSTLAQNEAWLSKHRERVIFHVAASAAGWLQQAEIWFSLLSPRELRRSGLPGAPILKQAINDFVLGYGPKRKPFRWRAGGIPASGRESF